MAYFVVRADDSSDGNHEKLLCAGGFAGFPSEFMKAERRWKLCLDHAEIGYFRSTECEGLRGEFHKFRRNLDDTLEQAHAKADAIRLKLIEEVNKFRLIGFAVTTILPDFYDVISNSEKARKHYGTDPAILTYKRMIYSVLETIAEDLGPNNNVAFVFDSHNSWEKAERVYNVLRGSNADPHDMLTSIGHADDKRVRGLQMADLMAYEGRFVVESLQDGKNPTRPTFKALLTKQRDSIGYMAIIDKKGLLGGLAKVPD